MSKTKIPSWVIEQGYRLLEYIECQNNMYIDTGVLGDNTKIFETKVQQSTKNHGFGSFDINEDDNGFGWYTPYNIKTTKMRLYYNARKYTVGEGYAVNDVLTYRFGKGKVTVNNEVLVTQSSLCTYKNPVNFIIGNGGLSYNRFEGKIFYVKIWDKFNLLKIDYIPCTDKDGNVGMLNLVDKVFKVSETENSFIAGPELTDYTIDFNLPKWVWEYGIPVEYLESTGTQWIDTGIVDENSDNTTHIEYRGGDGTVRGLFGYIVINNTINRNGGGCWDNKYFIGIKTTETIGDINSYINHLEWNRKSGVVGFNGKNTTFSIVKLENKHKSDFLFGRNDGTGIPYGNNWVGEIYQYKVYDKNTNLIQHLIPFLDYNNRPCMFDMVTKQYFYNQGTGEFLYGDKIHNPNIYDNEKLEEWVWEYGRPVEYLRSNRGTQWIDTGKILSVNEDNIKVKFYQPYHQNTMVYANDTSATETPKEWLYTRTNIGEGFDYRYYLGHQTSDLALTLSPKYQNKPHIFERNKLEIYWDGFHVKTIPQIEYLIPTDTTKLFQYGYDGDIFYFYIKNKCYLIPFLDKEGRPCMFDLINREYFYNQGSGEFLYGMEIKKPVKETIKIPKWVRDEGYIPVEYLKGNECRITTDWIPNIGYDSYEIKYRVHELDYINYLWGNYLINFQNNTEQAFCRIDRYTSRVLYLYNDMTSCEAYISETLNDLNTYTYKRNKYNCYVNDNLVTTLEPKFNKSVSPMILYECYGYNAGATQIYYFKQWDEKDQLIIDYLPVKHTDGRVGMLNLVNKELKVSETSTPFIAGPEIEYLVEEEDVQIYNEDGIYPYVQLEYILFNGNTQIDTKITIPDEYCKIKTKMARTVDSNEMWFGNKEPGKYGRDVNGINFYYYNRSHFNPPSNEIYHYIGKTSLSPCSTKDIVPFTPLYIDTEVKNGKSRYKINEYGTYQWFNYSGLISTPYSFIISYNRVSSGYNFVGKCYYFDFKTSEHDLKLIPVKLTSNVIKNENVPWSTSGTTNEVGMWDTVKNVFVGNCLSGEFTAGPEVSYCNFSTDDMLIRRNSGRFTDKLLYRRMNRNSDVESPNGIFLAAGYEIKEEDYMTIYRKAGAVSSNPGYLFKWGEDGYLKNIFELGKQYKLKFEARTYDSNSNTLVTNSYGCISGIKDYTSIGEFTTCEMIINCNKEEDYASLLFYRGDNTVVDVDTPMFDLKNIEITEIT